MQLKTKPFAHQQALLDTTADTERYALFWEMGCGKTKASIDTAALCYHKRKIDTIIILAPNGVERNWINDELPLHLPDEIMRHTQAMFYNPKKANAKYYKEQLKELLEHKGLSVLAMAYSAVMTNNGRDWLWKFLEKRRVFYIADEASAIKNPNAKRTKRVLASAKYAPWRRALTGTPIANGPFDAYSIMKFLDLGFWRKNGLDDYAIFKYHFGVFMERTFGDQQVNLCVGYKNLEELNGILKQSSSRVTKDDVLDLPPKLYSKRYFEMTSEQAAAYEDLKNDFMTWVGSPKQLVTAQLTITRLIRFRQIVCGYLPSDDDETPTHRFAENPRMEVFKQLIEEIPHSAIVWANFKPDIDEICSILGEDAVRYDGSVDDDQREKNKWLFQSGKKKWFVGNPAAAGVGLTLHKARTVIYYSSDYDLVKRLQSEDRAHRIGQLHPVDYIDIVAQDTVDERIIKALVKKQDVAMVILGDKIKEWI